MIHVHGRDGGGAPSQDKEVYREIIEAIREAAPDLIIQVSTGGAVGMTPAERLAPVELRPEMASLTCGTVNFGRGVFENPLPLIEEFAATLKKYGVRPELEIFDVGHLDTAFSLMRRGVVEPPLHFDFVLGVPGGMAGDPQNLFYLVNRLGDGHTWSVAGIGRHELPLAALAIVLGGHVRVGFEDNVYYSKGRLASSNAELVERVARLAAELGRPLATPAEARRILGLGGSVG